MAQPMRFNEERPARRRATWFFTLMVLGAWLGLTACQPGPAADTPVATATAPVTFTAAATDAAEDLLTETPPTSAEATATPTSETPTEEAQPAATEEPSPTATEATSGASDEELRADLEAMVLAVLPTPTSPDMGGVTEVAVFPLSNAEGRSLWVVHSVGIRSFDPLLNHFVTIYEWVGDQWAEVSHLELEGPDYLGEGTVQQVAVESKQEWLTVDGGAGAHGGTFNLLAFDGQRLTDVVSSSHVSPGAGQVTDLTGDGTPEVVLNQSEPYIFCYACGVRLVSFGLLRWNGSEWEEVTLEPLPDSAPDSLRSPMNQAVALAEAGLWQGASEAVAEATASGVDDERAAWNATFIQLHAEAAAEQAQSGAYPILDNLFYGDYPAILDLFRPYSADEIFSEETPLVVGTVAEGWENELTSSILQHTESALAVEPELAAAHYLRGWAYYLRDPNSPDARAAVKEAATFETSETLFTEAAQYLNAQTGE